MRHHLKSLKRAPLWKWIVIIFLVIAMPLLFSFYRSIQTERAIQQTMPMTQKA